MDHMSLLIKDFKQYLHASHNVKKRLKQGTQWRSLLNKKQTRNKVDRNAPITSKHVFPKRSAKMIDGTEKPKIPSKFAKRAARYNEYGYKN